MKPMSKLAAIDPHGKSETILSRAIGYCKLQFLVVGLFSGMVNLLQLTIPIYMMQIFDRVLTTHNVDTLLYLSLIAGASILLLAILEISRNQTLQRVATWVERKAAPEGFARAIESVLSGHSYRMEALRDLAICRGYLGSPALLALYDLPWVLVFLAVIFALHPVLGCIATAGAIVLFILTLLNELTTSRLMKEANVAAANSQRRADSIARNAEVIDSMGMLPAVMRRWQEGVAEMLPPQRRAAQRASLLLATAKFARLGVQIAVLGAGCYLVLQHDLTSGATVAGSIIMGRALAPVEMLIGGWKQLVQARQAFFRLQHFLSLPRLRPPGRPLPTPVGRLSVERVTYGLPGSTSPIVKGVQFALSPGDSLAVIGPSAAGKTTLIKMLIGTLAPSAGTVRLDGADVHRWMREDFGRYVGYLPQSVELFEGSVFRNIARMGDASPEQVYRAAQLAGCHDMILRLPCGYDTEIGENGQYLSGGQRQLIGLARALFRDPRFVVLDEPDSNLDGDSEANLADTLGKLKACGTTVVLVSHRPRLVRHVDLVLLMRDGAVEMFGPRVEVLNRVIAQPAPDNRPTITEPRIARVAAPARGEPNRVAS
ncbi:type I secretion system permease/ATPase [Bradyrhizobium sp. Arg237L]|uniref:type I secretion system permease/ATPase n=1 Tax=Bradyrhizobium sp. Arg237L TaxID=3003352 RepID=UPI00249F53A7|nr:type I secretion system permease/ATPase [Bradyrhizobium sp. Arg237L]MDI4232876.1 type I secretion system permease/ATPase [Bradyrhizobium sp. Arg237L]